MASCRDFPKGKEYGIAPYRGSFYCSWIFIPLNLRISRLEVEGENTFASEKKRKCGDSLRKI